MLAILTRCELRPFAILRFGQVGSLVGSALTGFALGVWLFQRSGAVTDLAVNTLYARLPAAPLSPLAGAPVDLHDRRAPMIASDCGAAVVTLAIAVLTLDGRLVPVARVRLNGRHCGAERGAEPGVHSEGVAHGAE